MPLCPAPDDFVFTTPAGAPIDEANLYQREWLPAVRAASIRPRPFYNARHTYISFLLAAGAKPLFVCRQAGTSLEMIERHCDDARVVAEELDDLISEFAAEGRSQGEIRNPPGTLPAREKAGPTPNTKKPLEYQGVPSRAGDRDRTGDVQLGKLAFYR